MHGASFLSQRVERGFSGSFKEVKKRTAKKHKHRGWREVFLFPLAPPGGVFALWRGKEETATRFMHPPLPRIHSLDSVEWVTTKTGTHHGSFTHSKNWSTQSQATQRCSTSSRLKNRTEIRRSSCGEREGCCIPLMLLLLLLLTPLPSPTISKTHQE